jgi:hypothetical protein
MPKIGVPVSTLQIEHHFVSLDACHQYYGRHETPDATATLWRIVVDGESIAEQAIPFAPGHELIDIAGDECTPVFGQIAHYVFVRRLNDLIVWFGVHTKYWYEGVGRLPHDFVYVFEAGHYRNAIESALGHEADDVIQPPELQREAIQGILEAGSNLEMLRRLALMIDEMAAK